MDFRIEGRILPEFAGITIGGHPTVEWEDASGWKCKMNVEISNGKLVVTGNLSDFDNDRISDLVTLTVDVVSASLSVFSVRDGFGLFVLMDEIELCGRRLKLNNCDPTAKEEMTSLQTNEDYTYFLETCFSDPSMLLMFRDMADCVKQTNISSINCSRIIDTICNYFTQAGKERKHGWEPMRSSLNISEQYLRFISDVSKSSRHGHRALGSKPDALESFRRTRRVLNRFLIYKKNNSEPLSLQDFPLLC